MKFGMALLLLLASCGSDPSSDKSDGRSRSESNTFEGTPARAFHVTDRVIPYGPVPEYEYSKTVSVDGRDVSIDYQVLQDNLTAASIEARNADSEATGRVCVCGCSIRSSLYLLPSMKALFASEDELDAFQIVRSCYKWNDGSIQCDSGPDAWTKRGWEEFGGEVVGRLNARDVDIFSEDQSSIDTAKVIEYIGN